jgi:hypothetical protein
VIAVGWGTHDEVDDSSIDWTPFDDDRILDEMDDLQIAGFQSDEIRTEGKNLLTLDDWILDDWTLDVSESVGILDGCGNVPLSPFGVPCTSFFGFPFPVFY